MLTITYNIIYIQGWFNSYTRTANSLYRIMVTTTSAISMMKMGNISHRAGINPTSLAFQSREFITPPSISDVPTPFIPACLCRYLPERSVQTATLPLVYLFHVLVKSENKTDIAFLLVLPTNYFLFCNYWCITISGFKIAAWEPTYSLLLYSAPTLGY